jgi:hypothetical protein
VATNTTATRQKRAEARRARAGAAWSKARSAAGSTRSRLGQSTFTCSGCGTALGSASAFANHNCGSKPAGKSGGKAKPAGQGRKSGGKVVPIQSRPAATPRTRRGGHPVFDGLVRATRAIAELDLTDGRGNATITADEFDDLLLQLKAALTKAGDNLDEFADACDRELRLDRRVTRSLHDLADAVGSQAAECAKDTRKRLRSVYADELSPGSKRPAAGFLP